MDQGRLIQTMLKMIGAVLIFVSCVILGMKQAKQLEKRQLFLRGAHQGILALMREIDYTAAPMQQALTVSADMAGSAGYLFLQTANKLGEGQGCTAGEAWQAAVASDENITTDDRQLLFLAGEGLGMSDKINQLKSLELLRIRLEQAENDAAEQSARLGKIWKTMGWGTAAVLILLLF